MSQDLPVTSYALLGLLTFGGPLTGYELKQRADRTLRFYWTAPAMSQVYSELERLHRHELVRRARPSAQGRRDKAAYAINSAGERALRRWLADTPPGFPVLKHPVALRLMLGALVDPAAVERMLRDHLAAVVEERAALDGVRRSLTAADDVGEVFHYPSMVADWGLSYFDAEAGLVRDLLARIEAERRG